MTITLHRLEFMRQFLLYGHVLSTEEAELYAEYELKKNPPTLDNFKEQVCILLSGPSFRSCYVKTWSLLPQCLCYSSPKINLFETLHLRVSKMEDRRVFCGWLQLDIKPFKHTLMNVIKKWSWMFKEHLLNHVNERLASFVLKHGETVLCIMYCACKSHVFLVPFSFLFPVALENYLHFSRTQLSVCLTRW